MKTRSFLLFFIGITSMISAQSKSNNATPETGDEPPLISVGVVAPDWKLPVLAMRTNVSLDIERGRVIVLNFWVKNSAPCAAIVPRLGALQAKYSQKNVEVLGINCHDTKQDVIGFMKKYRPHYRILTDGKEISEAYGVNAYPTIVLLDKNGKVLYAGDWDESKVDGLIDKALF